MTPIEVVSSVAGEYFLVYRSSCLIILDLPAHFGNYCSRLNITYTFRRLRWRRTETKLSCDLLRAIGTGQKTITFARAEAPGVRLILSSRSSFGRFLRLAAGSLRRASPTAGEWNDSARSLQSAQLATCQAPQEVGFLQAKCVPPAGLQPRGTIEEERAGEEPSLSLTVICATAKTNPRDQ